MMDIEKDYSCLEHNKVVLNKNIDVESEFQESLPAYCDDIYRVIKCVSNSFVTSVDIHFNEVKIFGKTEICLTYLNENYNLSYADFEEEFNKTIELENLSETAFCDFNICDKYTNFRVINQRRIDIHTSSMISLKVYDKVKCPCLSSCTDSKLKTEKMKTADIIASDISKIDFDEEFKVPADSPPIKRIVSHEAFVSLNETKIIKDKALIKATVSIAVLYTIDSDQEEMMKSEYSFNISKITDVPGILDDDISVTNLKLGTVYLKAKVSSGDKMNVIDVFGEVMAYSLFIRECEEDIITDGYILNRNSHCGYTDYNSITEGINCSDNKMVQLNFDLSSDIKEIKEIEVAFSNGNIRNNKIITQVTINVMSVNNEEELNSISSSGEIEFNLQNYNDAVFSFWLQSYDYTFIQNGKLEMRMNIGIDYYAYHNGNTKILSDINADDETIHYPSLTVYFGKKDETVWDIAKSFSSDESLILRENDLKSDKLDSNKLLIIPRV